RWRPDNGFFDPDTPAPDCHTALFSTEDVVRCPYALEWANNPKVLSIVGHALGAKPTLSNISIWWSYPGHEKPQEAENFHSDVDDLAFIKLFIYLTDVDDGCGPHVFVPGSQNKQIFGKIRRYSDEEIEKTFGRDGIKTFTGPQGSAFLENTFGLHKGQLPKKKRRLLFQAQYSLHPIGIYKYNPIVHSKILSAQFDNYTNRLYISK